MVSVRGLCFSKTTTKCQYVDCVLVNRQGLLTTAGWQYVDCALVKHRLGVSKWTGFSETTAGCHDVDWF